MAYFYIDTNGQKRGPINNQQLQALASQGIIQPTTILESESGKTGAARQLTGLTFGEPVHDATESSYSVSPLPDSFASGSFTPMRSQAARIRESVETTDSLSFFGWLLGWILDFRFSNLEIQTTKLLQFQVIQLWICRILYAINFVLAILSFVGTIVGALLGLMFSVFSFNFVSGSLGFLGLLFTSIGVLFGLVCVRTLLELWLLYVDWLVSARKAAKLYVANE